MHAFADEHDRPASVSDESGFGVGCTVHAVPSQRSASGSSKGPFRELPTATQVVTDGHDTADSAPSIGASGAGAGWTVHAVPSHRSARTGRVSPGLPTAVHAAGELHDTPRNV